MRPSAPSRAGLVCCVCPAAPGACSRVRVCRHALIAPLLPPPPDPRSDPPQESCARVLLFRGASKEVRNYNSQTAFQVQQGVPARRLPRGSSVCLSVSLPVT